MNDNITSKRRIYNDIYGLGLPYRHIHPYKQNEVKGIVDNIPAWVTHVIIFGSAVHSWHYYENDLDVCIVGPNPGADEDDFSYRKALKQKGCSYDFVEFPDMDALFAQEIDVNSIGYNILHEGVLVYEQSRLTA